MANLVGLRDVVLSGPSLDTGSGTRQWRIDLLESGTFRWSTNAPNGGTGNYSDTNGDFFGPNGDGIRSSEQFVTDEASVAGWGGTFPKTIDGIEVYVSEDSGSSWALFAKGSLDDGQGGDVIVKENQKVQVNQIDVSLTD